MESFDALAVRDVGVETLRNATHWHVQAQIFYETGDVGKGRDGTWTVRITNADDGTDLRFAAAGRTMGDESRQGRARFDFQIPAEQVCLVFVCHSSPVPLFHPISYLILHPSHHERVNETLSKFFLSHST